MKGFAAAQRAYEAQLPPEQDDYECPECNSVFYSVDTDGWITCDDCGFTIGPDISEEDEEE